MKIYFIDKNTLKIKDVISANDYSFNIDEETNATSTIIVHKKPNANQNDFIIAKNEEKTEFQGIITELEGSKESNSVTISCVDISNLFDRKVYVNNLALMDTSLEDFLYYSINKFFKTGDGDSKLAISYLTIIQTTQTEITEPLNDEDGIYNFHTFMTNCRQNKNISVDFEIKKDEIEVTIHNIGTQTSINIDATNSDIINYNKVYELDITAKVVVKCGDTGNILSYYLLTDRTISTNQNDPNRADGEVETIYVDEAEKAYEQAVIIFQKNRYNHLVEFEIKADSSLVDTNDLTIGRPIRIKTFDGILDSYISSIVKQEKSEYIKYKSGNIRVNLIDKLKQQPYKIGINKLDISNIKTSQSASTKDTYSCSYINSISGGITANDIFPVGSIIIKDDNSDCSSWLGFTWQKVFSGKVLVGQDINDTDFDTIGEIGGEKTHTLTENEMPKHTHWFIDNNSNVYNTIATMKNGGTHEMSQYTGGSRTYETTYINYSGNSQPHNNLQPYQVVAYWKRIS